MTTPRNIIGTEEMEKLLKNIEYFVNGDCQKLEEEKVRAEIEADPSSAFNDPDNISYKELTIQGQAAFNCLWKMPDMVRQMPSILAYIRSLQYRKAELEEERKVLVDVSRVAFTWLERHRSLLNSQTDADGRMQIELLYTELSKVLSRTSPTPA